MPYAVVSQVCTHLKICMYDKVHLNVASNMLVYTIVSEVLRSFVDRLYPPSIHMHSYIHCKLVRKFSGNFGTS